MANKLTNEERFLVDNFRQGLNMFRLETTRSGMIDVIEDIYKNSRVMSQGILGGEHYYLLLIPSEVTFGDLAEVIHSEKHKHYLRQDYNTQTFWECESRVGR
jgi:hypothetical protein